MSEKFNDSIENASTDITSSKNTGETTQSKNLKEFVKNAKKKGYKALDKGLDQSLGTVSDVVTNGIGLAGKGINTGIKGVGKGLDVIVDFINNYDEELIKNSKSGNYKKVKELIKNGANVNAKDKNNLYALLLAIENNHLDITEYLLKNGANPNIRTSDNKSLLSTAYLQESFDIVRVLIEHGADINTRIEDKPLFLVSLSHGNFNIVKILIDKGININTKIDGKSLLEIMLEEGNHDMFNWLIKNGADINTKINGKSLLEIVISQENFEMFKWLIENGVDLEDIFTGENSLLSATNKKHLDVIKNIVENDTRDSDKNLTLLTKALQSQNKSTLSENELKKAEDRATKLKTQQDNFLLMISLVRDCLDGDYKIDLFALMHMIACIMYVTDSSAGGFFNSLSDKDDIELVEFVMIRYNKIFNKYKQSK